MKLILVRSVLIFLGVFLSLSACYPQKTLIIEEDLINTKKEALRSGDEQLNVALKKIIKDANAILTTPDLSVTNNKKKIAPSGDKRDYVSVGQYWWPDPQKPDGLPYIRKDGKTNPDFYKYKDNSYLRKMAANIRLLSVAYYYTGDEKYAAKAASQLKTWFLNDKTRMNPNFNHAQFIPGRNQGRRDGIIDARSLVDVIDVVGLLEGSISWTKENENELKGWFKSYLNWMQTSKIGTGASRLTNNIGTAYYMQLISVALYTDNKFLARKIIKNDIPELIDHQFDKEGKQPEELKRTKSWNYSLANLNYWFRIARLAEHVGIDLWNYETPSGKSIHSGYNWLLPYANGEKKWEYKQSGKTDYRKSFGSINQRGIRKYRDNTSTLPASKNNKIKSRSISGESDDRSPILILIE
ncbi:alginate lyase family protein [Echinicola rosea]|uniref:Alginate lyase n=1 Tax=Echinicola rosea TaxID=1807691 RepID=A0ABQ1VBP2_9BACT|nr:alginate lyase family protein [Echinicola rosea]GGF51510.1 alginate lyase [Echinicola rosea]